MHSSRMRTGRSLTVCRSLLPGGCLLPGGLPALGGCLLLGGCPLQGVSASGEGVSAPGEGVCPWMGCLLPRGVYARGCLLRGGYSIPACTEADTPPPLVNRMTNRCKNITLATTSLRPVKRLVIHWKRYSIVPVPVMVRSAHHLWARCVSNLPRDGSTCTGVWEKRSDKQIQMTFTQFLLWNTNCGE